jgi:hypothetical protein
MTDSKHAIVITSINAPTESVRRLSALADRWSIVVVGDKKSPSDWHQPGVEFLSIEDQRALPMRFPEACLVNSYTRKNVGYLKVIADGAEVILETDDDNSPYALFGSTPARQFRARRIVNGGWVNVYSLFTGSRVWPRGFPLGELNASFRAPLDLDDEAEFDAPVQQFLADGDPDVDAIYRLTQEGEILFSQGSYVLSRGSYCPFNSQNTLWFREAFPLLYLPGHVSFRMTDIWRSFVAQLSLFAAGQCLAFHGPTVYQYRNAHSLMRDFEDEIPGYLKNDGMVAELAALDLGTHHAENLRRCYDALVRAGTVPEQELQLVELWLADLHAIGVC